MLQLEQVTDGSVQFDDQELTTMSAAQVRRLRPRMQMVFQNPHASLNPRMTVSSIIGEPLVEHNTVPRGPQRQERIEELLKMVGLDPTHANPLSARVLRRPASAHRYC